MFPYGQYMQLNQILRKSILRDDHMDWYVCGSHRQKIITKYPLHSHKSNAITLKMLPRRDCFLYSWFLDIVFKKRLFQIFNASLCFFSLPFFPAVPYYSLCTLRRYTAPMNLCECQNLANDKHILMVAIWTKFGSRLVCSSTMYLDTTYFTEN